MSAAAEGLGPDRTEPMREVRPEGLTRENWRNDPFNKWAFHHVDQVVPIAPVPAGGGVADLPEEPADLSGFSLKIGDRPALSLETWLSATDTDALVVLKDGRVAFERYGNGTTATTPHLFNSVTKAVVGLLLADLSERGEIDLARPVEEHVPEFDATGFKGASLRDLIDMRAGVEPTAEQAEAYGRAASSATGAATLHEHILSLRTAAAPHGGVFSYVSENTDVVGWAIERASGRKVADLLRERIWAPLGARMDGCIVVDEEGSPWCAGGFCGTARDFAALGDMLLNDGAGQGGRVVSAAVVDDLRNGGDRDAWRDGKWGRMFAPISPDMSYHIGWYYIHGDRDLLFAMGVKGQNLFIDRRNGLVVAKLSSWATREDATKTGLTHYALGEIRRCVGGG